MTEIEAAILSAVSYEDKAAHVDYRAPKLARMAQSTFMKG